MLWKSNKTAWVTRDIFVERITCTFCPIVKTYLIENNLPLHAFLVLGNTLGHPKTLAEILTKKFKFKFIKIQSLPSNTTPILQPMDQQFMLWLPIISSFLKTVYVDSLR